MVTSAKEILSFTESLNLEFDYNIYFLLSHVDYYLVNDSYNFKSNENTRVSYKEPYYYNFDGRRDISLRVVYFDNVAIAITQNAGREGDDHEEMFVLNRDLFIECVNYIDSLCGNNEFDRFASLNVIDESYNKNDLTFFYGYNVNIFNYDKMKELSDLESFKCNIGDVVSAKVYTNRGLLSQINFDKEEMDVVVESKSKNNLYRCIYGYLKNCKKVIIGPDYILEEVNDASLLSNEERVYVILDYNLEEVLN